MIFDEASARDWIATLTEGDDEALARLEQLVELLGEESRHQNLVSRASLAHVWQRHIADSAQLLLNVPRGTKAWLDIGTGAGFPGLVVSCLRPDIGMTLSEPRARRADWLTRAVTALGLTGTRVFADPVERIAQQRFDVISARAVAGLADILDLSAQFSTSTTLWRLPRGRNAQHELTGLRGWDHMFHVEQSLTEPDAGIVVGTLRGRKGATP